MRFFFPACLVALLVGCGDPGPAPGEASDTVPAKEPTVPYKSCLDAAGNLIIEDSALESALRKLAGVSEGPIPKAALSRFAALTLNDQQIQNIDALGELGHLKSLNLTDNQVSDLAPLARLVNLEELWLR